MRGGVLVVDDSMESCALAAEMLAGEGIVVTTATSGEEALARFAAAQPSCVLLDVGLPGVDGITVCERIRARPGGEHVAILFVTARRDVEVFDRALRAGGDDFLTKPFRPAELLTRIQTAQRLRQMASERGALTLELKHQRDELQRIQLQNEELAQFLIHDLANPVNSIELLAQRVLSLEPADARTHGAARKIREESRGLLHMIANLLDIHKSQEGRLVPAPRVVSVRDLVAAAVGDIQARAAAARLEVIARVDVERWQLDPDLVHRVLANLLENSVRHAPEDSAIEVVARADADRLELRVADRGPGVPRELRAALFERFAAAGPRGRHGLGLAFCRVAVAAHGGHIWVEDGEPGAVFCVELPHAG